MAEKRREAKGKGEKETHTHLNAKFMLGLVVKKEATLVDSLLCATS